MKDINKKILSQSSELTQYELIDLFEIDMHKYKQANILFTNGYNEKKQQIVYNKKEYLAYPCEFKGYSVASSGTSSRPTLTVANVNKFVTFLSLTYDDLVGAKITRRQVYSNYLDSVNFEQVNAEADPNCAVTSIFIIEAMKTIDRETAVFELSLPCETDGLTLPKRIMLINEFPGINRL